MAQLVRIGCMQHIAGIRIKNDRRIRRGGSGFVLAVPRFVRGMLAVRDMRCVTSVGVARGRRMDCDSNCENAEKAGVYARPSARGRMVCCQLSSPRPAIVTGHSFGKYAPYRELSLSIAVVMFSTPRSPNRYLPMKAGETMACLAH